MRMHRGRVEKIEWLERLGYGAEEFESSFGQPATKQLSLSNQGVVPFPIQAWIRQTYAV